MANQDIMLVILVGISSLQFTLCHLDINDKKRGFDEGTGDTNGRTIETVFLNDLIPTIPVLFLQHFSPKILVKHNKKGIIVLMVIDQIMG